MRMLVAMTELEVNPGVAVRRSIAGELGTVVAGHAAALLDDDGLAEDLRLVSPVMRTVVSGAMPAR